MSELYKRIENLCKENKTNVTQMCRESGASRGSLSDLKKGKTISLLPATLTKIANYFGVSVDYLLGNDEQKNKPTFNGEPISEAKQKLLDAVNDMSETEMAILLERIQKIKESRV